MTGVAWWSQTAGNNATFDSTVNWQEGQVPSSVNDSARAMMASTAKWRDDIAGAIVTAGTSTAYTVTSNQQFDTLARLSGQLIAFTPHTTQTGTCTLNVDGLGAKPLRTAPSVEVPSGTLIQGTPYTAIYNNTDGAFYLRGFFGNPYNIPLGGGLDYWFSTTPNSSFVFPVGQAISRTTYAAFFAAAGTTYGTGDGSTTFNLPDMRGRVAAAVDNMGGVTAGRLSSTYFGSPQLGLASGSDNHTLTTNEIPAHRHSVFIVDPGHSHTTTAASTSVNFYQAGGTPAANASAASISSGTTGISITSGDSVANATLQAGGGAPHAIAQPTICCNYILRII
ncbi:phage tail protein [Bradyrhizobium sp. UFLA03-84]|uniref:phage tail protein n=1 Tax=Bradyrhizobium sp. UFLA03-84 TaxID=418599 RepID=UPI000BAE56D3|nr:tail fiber protein [Bradyrhizobium sp. UFLA03-84]PAY06655.1 phage tail protein [Bradyrhizobium sp. UFLA03-84]